MNLVSRLWVQDMTICLTCLPACVFTSLDVLEEAVGSISDPFTGVPVSGVIGNLLIARRAQELGRRQSRGNAFVLDASPGVI